jgi:hypothetical protein
LLEEEGTSVAPPLRLRSHIATPRSPPAKPLPGSQERVENRTEPNEFCDSDGNDSDEDSSNEDSHEDSNNEHSDQLAQVYVFLLLFLFFFILVYSIFYHYYPPDDGFNCLFRACGPYNDAYLLCEGYRASALYSNPQRLR